MSRRSHVVRSDDAAPAGQLRALPGGEIFCGVGNCTQIGASGDVYATPLTVAVATSYQRFLVTATVSTISTSGGPVAVQLYCTDLDQVITSVSVLPGRSMAISGTIDLPAGDHQLCLRLHIADFATIASFAGAVLQAIRAQTVAQPECLWPGACL